MQDPNSSFAFPAIWFCIVFVVVAGRFFLRLTRRSRARHASTAAPRKRRRRSSSLPYDARLTPAFPPGMKPAAPTATATTAPKLPVVRSPEPSSKELTARVFCEAAADAGGAAHFVVQFKTQFPSDYRLRSLVHEVSLTCTAPDQEDYPVRTTNPAWRQGDRPDFSYRSLPAKPRPEDLQSADWVTLLRIPAEQLQFPRDGQHILRARVHWRDHQTGLTAARTLADCAADHPAPGYLDEQDETTQPDWAAARLLASLLYLAGNPPELARQNYWQWVEGRSNQFVKLPGVRAYRNARLLRLYNATGTLAPEQRAQVAENAARHIARIVAMAHRPDWLAFFLRFLAFKGQVTPPELQLAGRIGEWLEIKPDDARALRDKFLPVTMHAAASEGAAPAELSPDELLLGLTSQMSPEERRQRLNAEYRKWNARIDHPNTRIREQAHAMIEKIAQLRKLAGEEVSS
jgi:hypothetical protein